MWKWNKAKGWMLDEDLPKFWSIKGYRSFTFPPIEWHNIQRKHCLKSSETAFLEYTCYMGGKKKLREVIKNVWQDKLRPDPLSREQRLHRSLASPVERSWSHSSMRSMLHNYSCGLSSVQRKRRLVSTWVSNWKAVHNKMSVFIKTDYEIIPWQNASSHVWGSAVCLFRKGTFAASLIRSLGFLLT